MDINTDPNCNRTMDPDMAVRSSLGSDVTMALVATQVTHISMALMATRLSGTNMVSGICKAFDSNRNHRHQLRP